MATIIDGKATASKIYADLKEAVGEKNPGITMVLVGSHPASESYVKTKSRAAAAVGMRSEILRLPETITEKELLAQISQLNNDHGVHGILVQLPLPTHIAAQNVMMCIHPSKDVDGFHPINLGKLLLGDESGFIPCTPYGIFHLLKAYDVDARGKHAVILGRSNIVGKPLAALLMQKRAGCNATVTVAHSQTPDICSLCQSADILIAAMGRPLSIDGSMIKEGAIVIDVGINRIEDPKTAKGYRLVGDIDFDSVEKKCAMITPVPGGVGPMTVAMLLTNTWRSYLSHSA